MRIFISIVINCITMSIRISQIVTALKNTNQLHGSLQSVPGSFDLVQC